MQRESIASESEDPSGASVRYRLPPIVLGMLAPARRCNQRCPRCYLDFIGEPVTEFGLTPRDYVRFVDQVLDANVPIAGIAFQGYEVTLPESWPYLEAVFERASSRGVRKSFITNGMLFHKHAERIAQPDPQRISVSLDGASAEVNDRIRGLPGALEATMSSIKRFLDRAPHFQSRLGVVSCLYDDENARSLRAMPWLVRSLGISRWALSFELAVKDGRAQPAHSLEIVQGWLDALFAAAEAEGVHCFANDEFRQYGRDVGRIRAHGLYDPDFLVRFDPLGYVRSGLDVLDVWDEKRVARWDPRQGDAVTVIDYRSKVERWTRLRREARRRQEPTASA